MKLRNSLVIVASVLSVSFGATEPKKFAVVRAAFSQMEDGEIIGSNDAFVPGETIYFRCNIEGYKRGEKDLVHLTYSVEAKDSHGMLLQSAQTGKVETRLSEEDKDWLP